MFVLKTVAVTHVQTIKQQNNFLSEKDAISYSFFIAYMPSLQPRPDLKPN